MSEHDDLVHGWVSTDCGRGTSDILWSCLTTIILCVWTAVHLPIPLYRGQLSLSSRQKLVRSRFGPALIGIIAPEFLAITAFTELRASWFDMKRIRRLTSMRWTLTHQFFLDMGGICLKSSEGRHLQVGTSEVLQIVKAYPDLVTELEQLTEDQIKDLAKSDTLSKLIACGQAFWLVTQVVSRPFQHQAVTLLEVSTCAYVLCALLSYATWWKKPQGCAIPIVITCSDDVLPKLICGDDRYYIEGSWKQFIWGGRRYLPDREYERNDREDDLVRNFLRFATRLCPILFGAIHVASWNVRLPSNLELWMWRTSSIYCLAVGIPTVVFSVLIEPTKLKLLFQQFLVRILGCLGIVYVIVRVYMIVQMFLSLRALPRSAFESVQWSSFIPHL